MHSTVVVPGGELHPINRRRLTKNTHVRNRLFVLFAVICKSTQKLGLTVNRKLLLLDDGIVDLAI